MIYNFRFDRNNTVEILRRIKEQNLLSQGWGGGEECDLRVDQELFVAKCRDFYELPTTRVPTNLTRMRSFRNGDLMVTPHLPERGRVSIHVVEGDFPSCYDYLDGDPFHLNHRIRIKQSYGINTVISARNVRLTPWYGKLQWLRLPILEIERFESDFRNIVEELRDQPDAKFDVSELDEYLDKLRSSILQKLEKELGGISPSGGEISFEVVCERLLTSAGYRIEGRHEYDSAGGDVDLRCVRDRSDASPFETGQTTLFVQVKKHSGETDERAVEQLLKMIEKEPDADGCVMSLASNFTEEAVALSKKHGILLMNGEAICSLLVAYIAGPGLPEFSS